ncbi:MAG: hypothetical protein C4295_03235 [Candidatus Fervidibacterota bacterium]
MLCMPYRRVGSRCFVPFMLLSAFVSTLSSAPPTPSPPPVGTTHGLLIWRSRPKAVLFVMDGLSYRHVFAQDLKAVGRVGEWLQQHGSFALLNTMGYGGADRFRAAMSLACGIRAYGDETAAQVLQSDEPLDADTALDAYRRRLGNVQLPQPLPPFKSLVFPSLADLRWRNERMQRKPLPFGVVAQSLRPHGIRIVAIGCGDVPTIFVPFNHHRFRHGLLLALDEKGLGVGLTNPNLLLRRDPTMPFGVAVDEREWRNALATVWGRSDVLVLFAGETFRADFYGSERLLPYVIRRELQLLQPILRRLDLGRDLLLVFSLAPPMRTRYEHTFLIAAGRGIVSGGLLTSATTHQKGLVSILDIPATVLDFFGVEPAQPLNGAPIRSLSSSVPNLSTFLFGFGESARITDSWWRYAVLVTFCVAQTLLFLAVSLWLLTQRENAQKRVWEKWRSYLTFSLMLLAALPGSFHLLSAGMNFWLRGETALMLFMGVIAVFWVLLADVLLSRKASLKWLEFVVLFTCFVFGADATFGALSTNTPFGYSTFFGGRYYGLGNVGMGLTLGALVTAGMFDEKWWWQTALLAGLGAILVGAPFFGANVGGALTAIVVVAVALGAGRWRWWYLLFAIGFGIAFLGGFALFELSRPEPLTHWGHFVHAVAREGFSALLAMIWTKLGITFRAFRGIHWDIALATQVLLLFSLWWRGGRGWRWHTLVWGSLAALLFNDSGPQTPVAFSFLPLCLLSVQALTKLSQAHYFSAP